jgi:group II intron reverse transcriptase/maturase
MRYRKHPQDSAQSETPGMYGNSTRENRETPSTPVVEGVTGRLEKALSQKSNTHVGGESDGRVVPTKCPNNGGRPPAEGMEGRRPTKENIGQATAPRTQSRTSASSDLLGVREAASRDKRARFTALLHHVTTKLLMGSFYALKRDAAPGVDGVTWQEYETDLDEKLVDLHRRIHRGTYRAQPSKRAYIPKADGRQRPLGIAALEDKIVQQAVVTVLNQIYEEDFLGFSYGFRPGRSQHDALDALWVGLMRKKVNWILDADVRGFFDNLSHQWLVKFVEHRVAERRILRLIRKWLKAGVSEEGEWSKTEVGTPQGSVASPLLANIYLHYVFDLWARHWRKHHATGDVIVVRYADDAVVGFEHRADAERFLHEWKARLQKFGLELHPDKTRLIEFGRHATENRKQSGEGKPEVFNFLGFTHICGKTRKTGRFIVRRKTIQKRLSAKLSELKAELRRRWHQPVAEVGKWLRSVVQGYFNYHAVPGNMDSLNSFRAQVIWRWHRALRRRSQRDRRTWERSWSLVDRWIPSAKILHPHPNLRFDAKYPR